MVPLAVNEALGYFGFRTSRSSLSYENTAGQFQSHQTPQRRVEWLCRHMFSIEVDDARRVGSALNGPMRYTYRAAVSSNVRRLACYGHNFPTDTAIQTATRFATILGIAFLSRSCRCNTFLCRVAHSLAIAATLCSSRIIVGDCARSWLRCRSPPRVALVIS